MTEDWETRMAAAWAEFDEVTEDAFLARVDALAAELPHGDPRAAFERGGAFDSTGHPDRAVALYREAIDLGLDGELRRQAVIQLASSLRNLGDPEAALDLLSAELTRPSDGYDDAVRAFLALTLTSLGREREAVSVLLKAITPHLPRYHRSVTAYADELLAPPAQ